CFGGFCEFMSLSRAIPRVRKFISSVALYIAVLTCSSASLTAPTISQVPTNASQLWPGVKLGAGGAAVKPKQNHMARLGTYFIEPPPHKIISPAARSEPPCAPH